MKFLNSGFKRVLFFAAVCGGEIEVDNNGHLESPNYPDDYQPNKLCVWRLTVPQVSYKILYFDQDNSSVC